MKKVQLVIGADELGSFVGSNSDAHGVWLARDAETRRAAAMVVGDSSGFTAHRLWLLLPEVDCDTEEGH